jgi:hypothetical protein
LLLTFRESKQLRQGHNANKGEYQIKNHLSLALFDPPIPSNPGRQLLGLHSGTKQRLGSVEMNVPFPALPDQ